MYFDNHKYMNKTTHTNLMLVLGTTPDLGK